MKAITTKFLGATNYRGGRIKAYDGDNNSVTVALDSGVSIEESHRKAAIALRDKMKWTGDIIGGGVKTGMVFVFSEDSQAMAACKLLMLAESMQAGKRDGGTMGAISTAIDAARAAVANHD